ncbi:MAG: translation initiation factor IF-2 [Bacteroidales bacterium]|nr:translation initiation factor IF-2 [Bacteroidales bacterium]
MRLNRIAKEFNVGVQTLVEFLEKKAGVTVEGPMANVTDEQYEMLRKEFNKDKSVKEESERERQERQHTREKIKEETKAAPEKAQTPSEKSMSNVGLKVVGQIDLNPKKEEAPKPKPVEKPAPVAQPAPVEKKVEKKAEKPAKPAPANQPEAKVEAPKPKPSEKPAPAAPAAAPKKPNQTAMGERSRDRINDDPLPKEARNGEVFRVEVADVPQVNVVGHIDLNSINQSTRPKKKSKEERKKEREQKNAAQQAQREESRSRHHGAQKVDINEEIKKGNSGGGGRDKKSHGDARRQDRDELRQRGGKKGGKNQKIEITDEDIQRSVRETLERQNHKLDKKGVKYRKDKRNAAAERAAEAEEAEAAQSKILKLTEFVTANDLATMMNVPVVKVISTCMTLGLMVSINQRLDADTINLVAEEFGFQTEYVSEEVEEELAQEADAEDQLVTRPPVITVMGHVDHGKTKLLDYIRNTNVIAGEAGGITQHIGAYSVKMADGRRVTFLDTPGHEAFTAMRARGAKMTDIAIIIVAADDGVMPQTKEAINHAAAAGVPIVFAINKIDKPTANPMKVREQLSAMNYLVESWGGKYQDQDISAREGLNVDLLLEKVLLEADLLDLKANPNREASGSVIESTLDKGRGYTATVLVQNGTLHVGDVLLCGKYYGRCKALFNERGQKVEEAGPATPVQVLGLNGSPSAGDQLRVLPTEQEAREIAQKRDRLQREQALRTQKTLTLDEIGRRLKLGDFQELNLIVKGDVDGSVEALTDSLIKLSTENIQINVIHKAVGQISESDVVLAAASKAIIIGFNVRPSSGARKVADQDGVDIRTYSIIYDAIEEVKEAMEGMLKPVVKEEISGTAEVRSVFKISKVGAVAGCLVKEGKIHRTDKARVIRDGIVIFTGELAGLKRFKDDVKEVGTNFECGLSLVNYDDIQEGDLIEAFTEVEVKAKL